MNVPRSFPPIAQTAHPPPVNCVVEVPVVVERRVEVPVVERQVVPCDRVVEVPIVSDRVVAVDRVVEVPVVSERVVTVSQPAPRNSLDCPPPP